MARTTKPSMTATEIFDQIEASQKMKFPYKGFIRKLDSDTEIELSFGDGWERIPTSSIGGVAFIENDFQDEEEYPFIKIYLKEPETEEGQAFAAIARLSKKAIPRPISAEIAKIEAPFLDDAGNFNTPPMLFSSGRKMKYDDRRRCYYYVDDPETVCRIYIDHDGADRL